MKKLLAILTSILLLCSLIPFGAIPVSAATSGTTGDCTWTLNGTHLTISGEGKMGDYHCDDAPAPWGTSITSVTIEDGVTSIGTYTFYDCDLLTAVTIPDSVITIEDFAFVVCDALSSVTFGNGVTSIGEQAFSDCASLTSITIPDSVTTIKEGAFWGCDSLKKVTIPDSVITIEDCAFENCDALSSVTIGNGVTSIGEQAFENCENITSLTIGSNVKVIKDSAFYSCKSLTSLTIPNSVVTIEEYALGNMWNLSSLTIGNSVTYIGECAFSGNESLEKITIPKSVTTIDLDAFEDCDSLTDVYYTGSKADRNKMSISRGNDLLLDATWHYNAKGNPPTPSTKPTTKPTTSTKPTTVPTAPSEPTTSTTPTTPTTSITPVNPDGYVINVYAELPSLVIGVNQTIGAAVQVEKDGVVIPSANQFTITVSDRYKTSVSNIRQDDDLQCVRFDINGHTVGEATLTIQEATTGAMYTTTLVITDGILTYNAEALPEMQAGKAVCNGIVNGIYVDNFSTKPKEDDPNMLLVSFDAYNESILTGVVDVYDTNHNLVDTRIIKRFEGNTVSGYYDTLKQGWYLLKAIAGAFTEEFNYQQPLFSQETNIRDLAVPVGGYIEITNNVAYSDTCMLVNVTEWTIATVLTSASSAIEMAQSMKKEIAEEVTSQMIAQITASELKTVGKELRKELLTPLVEASEKQATADNLSLIVDGTLSIVRFGDIDLKSLMIDAAAKTGAGIAENIATTIMGSYGVWMEMAFSVVEFAELYAWRVKIGRVPPNNALRIYFNDTDGCLTANGVTIQAEDGSSLAAQNFVMHSVVVTPDNGLNNAMKSALDKLSDKYVVRDIYLEQNGEVTQPGQTVQVSVPIPEGYDPNDCSIYWVQEDGTLTKIHATVKENYLLFYTNHFSYYAIVEGAQEPSNGITLWIWIAIGCAAIVIATALILVLKKSKSFHSL